MPPPSIYLLYIVIPIVVASVLYNFEDADFARLAAIAALSILILHILGVPSLAEMVKGGNGDRRRREDSLAVRLGGGGSGVGEGRSPAFGRLGGLTPPGTPVSPSAVTPSNAVVKTPQPQAPLPTPTTPTTTTTTTTTTLPEPTPQTDPYILLPHRIPLPPLANYRVPPIRHVVEMEASAEAAFDFLSDVGKRPVWDEMCESGGVVTRVSRRTTVQYFRTKGLWPTSPREALVASFITLLPPNRYLNVTTSIPSHPQHTPHPSAVRMLARIAGQIVTPHPDPEKKHMCRVVQIIDGDLGGYLPKRVVAMVTTQAIPRGMGKANRMLRGKEGGGGGRSVAIEIAEGRVEVEGLGGGGAGVGAGVSGLEEEGGGVRASSSAVGGVKPLPAGRVAMPAVQTSGNGAATPSVVTPTAGTVATRAALLPIVRSPNRYQIFLRLVQRMQPMVIVSLLFTLLYGRWRRKR
ncbi:hypothetical protein HDV00_003929 [Rhizophlyctis rosea]|nr:hypothetical protein HDV00_003929 [Rhizophlyctis rosea]